MPRRTSSRSNVGAPGKTRFERSARRWYIRRKQTILFGCKIVFLSVLTGFLISRSWTKKYTKGTIRPQSHCTPRLNDFEDSTDPLYRSYIPLGPPSSPFPVLAPDSEVPLDCLEEWIVSGRTACNSADLGSRLDVVWSWVNGSDPRWKQEMLQASREEGIFSPGFHFRQVDRSCVADDREQNELQYSMRSVMSALPSSVDTAHLVVADYSLDSALDYSYHDKRLRTAQTPSWLDFGKVGCSPEIPRFQLATHHEIFHLPFHRSEDNDKEAVWKKKALPTFNSKVIESRFGWLPGLVGLSEIIADNSMKCFSPLTTTFFYYDRMLLQTSIPRYTERSFALTKE